MTTTRHPDTAVAVVRAFRERGAAGRGVGIQAAGGRRARHVGATRVGGGVAAAEVGAFGKFRRIGEHVIEVPEKQLEL